MHDYSGTPVPFTKGDKLRSFQSPRNQLDIDQMKSISYASTVGGIMYAQVCTRPDLAFITRLLRIFQCSLGMKHWKATKKALSYL
jgi:hypothetical protein